MLALRNYAVTTMHCSTTTKTSYLKYACSIVISGFHDVFLCSHLEEFCCQLLVKTIISFTLHHSCHMVQCISEALFFQVLKKSKNYIINIKWECMFVQACKDRQTKFKYNKANRWILSKKQMNYSYYIKWLNHSLKVLHVC